MSLGHLIMFHLMFSGKLREIFFCEILPHDVIIHSNKEVDIVLHSLEHGTLKTSLKITRTCLPYCITLDGSL